MNKISVSYKLYVVDPPLNKPNQNVYFYSNFTSKNLY